MERRIASVVGTLLLTMVALGVQAQAVSDDLKKNLQSRFPEIEIRSVSPSPIAEWYEVVTPNELVYTNGDGSLLFTGRILDTRTRDDLTARRWNAITAIDFNSLPLGLAIKAVRGNGSRKLAVFSDPHCPYCKRLEKELQNVTDVTIYTFLFPLEGLHPGAAATAHKVWCAENREEVWTAWMVQQVVPESGSCEKDPMATLAALGEKLGVTATPTLFFANGQRIAGAIPGAQLEQELAAAASGPAMAGQ